MNTLTHLVDAADDQISQAFTGIGCDVEVGGEYGEPDRFTVISESLTDFEDSAKNWHKCGSVEKGDNYIIFRDAAPKSGDQRHDLYVIDFGAARIACKF